MRVLLGDSLEGGGSQSLDMEQSFFSDPTLSRYHVLRHREELLALTIERFPAVANATVHIAQSDPTPFLHERTPTTASVVLELYPGRPFSQEQAVSVVNMLSKSVEGLLPENVTVIDSKGQVLAADGGLGSSAALAQFDYRRRVESDLAGKATIMLDQMLGLGRAVVRVTADIDFTQIERTEKIYDPDLKVRKSEDITSTTITGAGDRVGGVPGVASNIGNATGVNSTSPYSETTESNKTEFENAFSEDRTTRLPGQIQRLTIAAIVSMPTAESETPGGTGSPIPTATQEQIANLIKRAVGFDTSRGDEIEVVLTEMVGQHEQEQQLAAMQRQQLYQSLARSGSLAIAAIVALVLGLFVIRKLPPFAAPPAGVDHDRARRLRVVQELSQKAHENPNVLKAVVSSWLRDEPPAGEVPPRKAA